MKTVGLIPAYNVESSIADTVRSLLSDQRVDEVIVVDDASQDSTSSEARSAGATVVRLERNRGMGGALTAGLATCDGNPVVLIVDGDTGASASAAVDLVDPIVRGEADMVLAILPRAGRLGGFGSVLRIAEWLIARASGFHSKAPLSGQRAVTADAFRACLPLAPRYGANPAFTADAARLGFRILEIPVEMTHDHRGRTLAGFAHRARQGWDLIRTLGPRALKNRLVGGSVQAPVGTTGRDVGSK